MADVEVRVVESLRAQWEAWHTQDLRCGGPREGGSRGGVAGGLVSISRP